MQFQRQNNLLFRRQIRETFEYMGASQNRMALGAATRWRGGITLWIPRL